MPTQLLDLNHPQTLPRALATLAAGDVLAAPTDTVYGLFASVDNVAAIEQLYRIKQRPRDKAIPVLIGDIDQLDLIVAGTPSALAQALMARFWPGALTIVLTARDDLPSVLTAGQPTIAVRLPNHDGVRALLRASGPLAVTSANRSGANNVTTAEEVVAQLGECVPLVLDGGATPGDVASTIVDVSGDRVQILRRGMGAARIEEMVNSER